ncbi:hypothetical protein B0T16DRAFT_197385 [Cercophora newfieldiana]|uniref:Uncharacterized protein n=1 Tax=Cercophora newfieldiana TaxID=92897 RepID=A0AA39Y2D4_9PEZI|nr:hypothetical protein B0T16DRAFT_197385 [Cercophora newfieldiana]
MTLGLTIHSGRGFEFHPILCICYLPTSDRGDDNTRGECVQPLPTPAPTPLSQQRPLYPLDSALFCVLARRCLHPRYKHPNKGETQRKDDHDQQCYTLLTHARIIALERPFALSNSDVALRSIHYSAVTKKQDDNVRSLPCS